MSDLFWCRKHGFAASGRSSRYRMSSAESSSSSATVCAGAGRVWATEDPVHRFVRWSRLGVFVRIFAHT